MLVSIKVFIKLFFYNHYLFVRTLIEKLKSRNCAVYLVSGGLEEIIEPVARILSINKDHIYANRIKYFYNG